MTAEKKPAKKQSAGVLPIASILVTPGANPRTVITQSVIEELALSIDQRGAQIAPIACRPLATPGPNGETHELVDGETRLRAKQFLGHDTIVAVWWEMTDDEAEDVRLHANIKRWMLDAPALYRVIVKRWEGRPRGMADGEAVHSISHRTGLPVSRVRDTIAVHRDVAPDLVESYLTRSSNDDTWRDLIKASKIQGHENQRHWWEHHLNTDLEPTAGSGHRGKSRPSQGDAVRLAALIASSCSIPLARGAVALEPAQAEAVAELVRWLAGRNAGAIDLTQRPKAQTRAA